MSTQPDKPWIALSAALLRGEGLASYPPGDIGTLFDWVENPAARSAHAIPHAGQFLVDVVQIEANAVHQPSKPDDEVVLVLDGVLELTDDADGRVQRFAGGEIVFIPKGWAGIYRCSPADRPFLELAIVPHDYFAPSTTAPSGASPQRIVMPGGPGEQHFHRGRYGIDAQGSGIAWQSLFENAADEVLIVTAGLLTLSAEGVGESFGAGSVVVLPRGARGEGATSADYQALALNWLDAA